MQYPALSDLRDSYKEPFNMNVFGTAFLAECFVHLLSASSDPSVVFLSSVLGSIAADLNPDTRYTAW